MTLTQRTTGPSPTRSPGDRATRRRRTGRRLAVAAAALLGISALVIGGPTAFVQGTTADKQYTVASAPTRPVALVLGAEIYPSGRPSPFLEGRLQTALELYQAGKVRVILVSGDNSTQSYNEPDGMRNWLIRRGVPASKVVADYAGFDTYASCVRAKEIFGVNALTVVSQQYHVPRALATCRAVGIDAIGVGDTSVRPDSRTWQWGEFREVGANIKMAIDVLTQRRPTLGPRETSVDEALAAS
ncbi:SanA/YdcF family protein [Granulicoccus phenolivorans]|uniref:SanA/YdcF family protein n=1 Tax=Granulicoccus phenolivorans TaxID=266854 RepID=UPI000423C58D|nr:ElyC/SanA/YdcF family protein [Granulicoccus phenolivorans]